MSHHIIRLRMQRRRWGLNQDELADLVGISQSVLSRLEKAEVHPDAGLLFKFQVVFGLPPRAIFPGLYRKVEDAVMAAGAKLDQKIAHRKDSKAEMKRRLLQAMAYRAKGGSGAA